MNTRGKKTVRIGFAAVATTTIVAGIALSGTSASAAVPGQSAYQTVKTAGTYTTSTIYTAPDSGGKTSMIYYATFSSVSAKSATLTKLRLCVGTLPKGAASIHADPGVESASVTKDLGQKWIPSQQCNTWNTSVVLKVSSKTLFAQIATRWPWSLTDGAALTVVQYQY